MSDEDESKATIIAQGAIDTSGANGALYAAIAKAQDQARTVTKGGYNKHASYKYATAEDMIAAGRAARRGTGLALVTSWSVQSRDDAPPLLTLHWLLAHGEGGVLRGSLIAPVQPSKRNGGDKQTAALATYLEGFAERSLMRLDREGTPPEEDRDSHDDTEDVQHAAVARERPANKPSGDLVPETELAAQALLKARTTAEYDEARKVAEPIWRHLSEAQKTRLTQVAAESKVRIAREQQAREDAALESLEQGGERDAEGEDTAADAAE